jgi:hypothetical protein
VFCVAVLAASAGCFGSATHGTSGSAETAISGTLRIVGGPAPGLPRPIRHAKVNVIAGARVVATMTTDERGRFSLRLPPGTYAFALKGGPGLLPPTAVVAATGTTHLSLRLEAK